jgi:undecaprenyl diphosphate synthase
MDGNGRWGSARGKSRLSGHSQGAKTVRRIVQACPDLGVRYLTLYAFSSENWNRDPVEVTGLLALFERYLRKEIAELHARGVCLRVIGSRQGLSQSLVRLIEHSQDLTRDNTALGLAIAFNYGGRGDIIAAAQEFAQRVQQGQARPQDLTESAFSQLLWTWPWPDPDFCLRTGGQYRLSNYLLWQLSYAELAFTPTLWPDFTPEELARHLQAFGSRTRQFGHAPDGAGNVPAALG